MLKTKPVTQEELILLQNHLMTLRLIFGLSHEDIAKYLGFSKNTIKRIENGKSRMTKSYYYAIRKCFEDKLEEKRFDIFGNVMPNIHNWYCSVFHLYTNIGTETWETRRKEIEKIVFGVYLAYKKHEPEFIGARVYDALHANNFKNVFRGLPK